MIEVGGPRVQTRNSHGTGCSLSSALTTVQARTGDWEASLREVKPLLREALIRADDLEVGHRSGPIHHFHHLGETSRPGAFAALLWKEAAVELEAIHGLAFIRDLGSGELPESEFSYYLAQDALYLNGYSRCLPGRVPSLRRKKSSCSGPGVPNSALTWNPNCTGTG